MECLPGAGEDSAKDLALWGIAAFLGACFGPAITGPLLTMVGAETVGNHSSVVSGSGAGESPSDSSSSSSSSGDGVHYSREGYVAVMIVGMLYSFACGISVMRVQQGNAKVLRYRSTAAGETEGGSRCSGCCCCSRAFGRAHRHEPLPDAPSEEPAEVTLP